MFYIGKTFNEAKKQKQYKSESGACGAAEKKQLRVYDEAGKIIADYVPVEPQDAPQEATQAADGQNPAPDAGDGKDAQTAPDDVAASMTNNVPDGALDAGSDGSVNVYDDAGKKVGSMSAADAKAAADCVVDGDVVKVRGSIRKLFTGLLRVRNRPSWDPSAVAGTTVFDVRPVVGVLTVDGKPMYKLPGGLFITGDPELVEFIPDAD